MKTYIGTKSLEAEPMMLGEYNIYKKWNIPADEDPYKEGYLVKYEDGHESWSPFKTFQEAYKSDGNFNFGHALHLLNRGYRVCRVGWNGKNMFLFKVGGSVNLTVNREPLISILGEGAKFNYQPHIDMFTADGTIVPWICNQSDMLAEDWMIVADAED